MWTKTFKSQNYNQPTYKHIDLPVYQTKEFDFYRCVEFRDDFYGKTASELHDGNLRICSGRYTKLFPGQKLSYWADSPDTARAEVKIHGAGKNLLTFWAYDDASSFMPTTEDLELLTIIDGRKCGIQEFIDKADREEELTADERKLLEDIMHCEPDALAYDSHARKGGENFIFFEKGFRKLSLREVRLRLGERSSENSARIYCAGTCDYTPYLESYGEYFAQICKVKMDNNYLSSEEYKKRKHFKELHFKRKFEE